MKIHTIYGFFEINDTILHECIINVHVDYRHFLEWYAGNSYFSLELISEEESARVSKIMYMMYLA
jgi:hypothetical protein